MRVSSLSRELGKARGSRADDLVTREEVDMCHDYSAGGKTFTQCHTKSHGVAFDTQVLWLLANGREACALLCNHRSLLHVFSLVQTTIGFGNPCRIGSLAYHMRSVCVSGAQAVDNWLCRCHWSN